jgi:hypothetical protein
MIWDAFMARMVRTARIAAPRITGQGDEDRGMHICVMAPGGAADTAFKQLEAVEEPRAKLAFATFLFLSPGFFASPSPEPYTPGCCPACSAFSLLP